ncbi:MAG TPA: alpha/beta fold hydrolase [Polyangia bacterium]|nr:alpha/beta fold hydrolase [Polyangia bacterium]
MELDIGYEAAGRSFGGVFLAPATTAAAGVLVLHGGGGPTAHDRDVARRFARLGYAAYAPDLFGQVFADRREGAVVIGALVAKPELLRTRLNAALDRLRAQLGDATPLAVVGHCFGGLAALELARSGARVCAAVAIHGGLHTREPARAGGLQARILACTGAADPYCPPEHRAAFEAEMTAAGADWQHHVYGGAAHGFSIPGASAVPGVAFHEPSARRSWDATLALLRDATTTAGPDPAASEVR